MGSETASFTLVLSVKNFRPAYINGTFRGTLTMEEDGTSGRFGPRSWLPAWGLSLTTTSPSTRAASAGGIPKDKHKGSTFQCLYA